MPLSPTVAALLPRRAGGGEGHGGVGAAVTALAEDQVQALLNIHEMVAALEDEKRRFIAALDAKQVRGLFTFSTTSSWLVLHCVSLANRANKGFDMAGDVGSRQAVRWLPCATQRQLLEVHMHTERHV